MKNFTEIELKAIYDGLQHGKTYTLVKNGYCSGTIAAGGDGYIHYQVCGSSAIDNTINRLKWLLTDLFSRYEDITPAVYSMEIFNTVDLTGRYRSIDLSRYHKEIPETIYNGEFYYKIANGEI